jgi:hypothetical protein
MFTINNAQNPYNLPEFTTPTIVNYVMYTVNTEFRVPYLTFYLAHTNNILTIPFTTENHHLSTDRVSELLATYRPYVASIEPMGYVVDNNEVIEIPSIYVFYEVKLTTQIDPDSMSDTQPIWPVLCWEIFQTGTVCTKIIDVTTIRALAVHLTMTPINESDPDDDNYTSSNLPYPMVGYSVHSSNRLRFSSIFGSSRDPLGEFGDYYYYYSDFDRVILELDRIPSKNGVVRYILYEPNITDSLTEFKQSTNILGLLDDYIISHKLISAKSLSYHLI